MLTQYFKNAFRRRGKAFCALRGGFSAFLSLFRCPPGAAVCRKIRIFAERNADVPSEKTVLMERNETIEMMKARRSVRKFKSDPVPRELIDRIIEAGTFAASGHDRQPWAIIAVTDKEVRDRLSEVNATFFDMPVKDPFYGAPAIIVVLCKTFTPTYVYDGSLAIGNMMLAARSLGLSSCWIHRAKQVFALPEWQEWLKSIGVDGEYEGIGHIALGYSDGPEPEARPRKAGRVFYVE